MKRFSNTDLKKRIVPLFLEQLLVMLVGIADTLVTSYAGEAAVSGVSLVNQFNTIFIYLFTAVSERQARRCIFLFYRISSMWWAM
jgi:Na+-driven multidrug efflux pump